MHNLSEHTPLNGPLHHFYKQIIAVELKKRKAVYVNHFEWVVEALFVRHIIAWDMTKDAVMIYALLHDFVL